MCEANPTSGTAYNKREGYSTVYVFVPIGRGLVQEVAACGPTEAGQDEQQANADLITEAFTVRNTSGLTPSQLVERVKELEEALQDVVTHWTSQFERAGHKAPEWCKAARAALSKARPNTAEGEAAQQAPGMGYPTLPMQFACSGVFPVYSADQMRAYVDADRAARAPADSVMTPSDGGTWQDISTAPKDGTRFVAVGHNYGLYSETQHTCIAQWFRGCWMEASDWNETSELKYLTHWMPLLPLPTPTTQAAPVAAKEPSP